MKKRATCGGEREVKKATQRSPPTTSPSDKSKRFEEELRKAMDMSQKEVRKGDGEEIQ